MAGAIAPKAAPGEQARAPGICSPEDLAGRTPSLTRQREPDFIGAPRETVGGMLKLAYTAIAIAASVAACSASAQEPGRAGNVRVGRELAVTTCSECHQVVPRRLTPRHVGGPPDFADVATAPGTTRTALFVFLHTPHPTMPSLVLSNREANDVIAYILSLRSRAHH